MCHVCVVTSSDVSCLCCGLSFDLQCYVDQWGVLLDDLWWFRRSDCFWFWFDLKGWFWVWFGLVKPYLFRNVSLGCLNWIVSGSQCGRFARTACCLINMIFVCACGPTDPSLRHAHNCASPVSTLLQLMCVFELFSFCQLGMTYYIFPGATHNRFEHSIGVAHLAKTWMEILKVQLFSYVCVWVGLSLCFVQECVVCVVFNLWFLGFGWVCDCD